MCDETVVYLGQVGVPLPCPSQLEPVDADRPQHLAHEDVVRQTTDLLDDTAQHEVAEVGVGKTCSCSNIDVTSSEQ